MPTDSGNADVKLRFLYLSPAARYALLGLRALALANGHAANGAVRDAAARGGLPANMLAKVFQRLATRGLLLSRRGPGGGYRLARPQEQISLADILRAVEDIVPGGNPCLLRNRDCGPGHFCLIHQVIHKADRQVIAGLESLSLRDLAESGGWI